jgi:hypothetical protein
MVGRHDGAGVRSLGAPARGRLVGESETRPPEPPTVRGAVVAGLVCLLPLFAQTFQYVVDVPPLYVLSKAWPILMAPLALLGATRVATPFKPLVLATIVWTWGVAPATSVIELGNSYVGAASTALKVLSLSFGFALPAVLMILKPTQEEVRRVILGLGIATFVIMTLLFLLAPASLYEQGILETKLFLRDENRGKRIYAPMFFGMMAIFFLNRSFWLRPRLWKAVGIAAAFLVLLLVYKQRTAIAAAMLCVLIGTVLSLPRGRLTAAALLIAIGAWPMLILIQSITADLQSGFGSSFSVRQMELIAALAFLNDEPLRWLTGVGSMTRAGDVSFADVVDADVFFLADLGWIGVVFEYGAIGAGLLLLLHLAVIWVCARAASARDPLPRALLDYSLYILASSAVYSVVFAPGELMTCLGLAWWFQRSKAGAVEPPQGKVLWTLARRTPLEGAGSRGVVLGRASIAPRREAPPGRA